jgi:hypothetical protein
MVQQTARIILLTTGAKIGVVMVAVLPVGVRGGSVLSLKKVVKDATLTRKLL